MCTPSGLDAQELRPPIRSQQMIEVTTRPMSEDSSFEIDAVVIPSGDVQ